MTNRMNGATQLFVVGDEKIVVVLEAGGCGVVVLEAGGFAVGSARTRLFHVPIFSCKFLDTGCFRTG